MMRWYAMYWTAWTSNKSAKQDRFGWKRSKRDRASPFRRMGVWKESICTLRQRQYLPQLSLSGFLVILQCQSGIFIPVHIQYGWRRQKEATEEYFYKDITNFSTSSDTEETPQYDPKQKKNILINVDSNRFALTVQVTSSTALWNRTIIQKGLFKAWRLNLERRKPEMF